MICLRGSGSVPLHRIRFGQLELSHRPHGVRKKKAWQAEDATKFSSGFGSLVEPKISLTADKRGIEGPEESGEGAVGDGKFMGIWNQRLFDCACGITTLERKHSAKGRKIVVSDRGIFRKAILQVVRERLSPRRSGREPQGKRRGILHIAAV